MLRFKKGILLLLVLALVVVGACAATQDKKVRAMGWYMNTWANNVIKPLGITAEVGDWIPVAEWGKYDTVILTQGVKNPQKLNEEEFIELINWISLGNSIILANNSMNVILETGTYNKPEIAPLTGVSYYNIAKFGEGAVVLDNQHPLTNHMSVGESVSNWKDEGYYYAKVTTAQRLVGFNGTGVQQDSGWVFVNQIGKGYVYTIIPVPAADAPVDLITLCKKAVLLACGEPIPEP